MQPVLQSELYLDGGKLGVNLNTIYHKAFMSPYFFTIAIRRNGERTCFEDQSFVPDYVIPANHRNWCADPILAEDHGKNYLFYEAVSNNLGRIEVVEVFDDCSVSKPTVILESDCHHYSYPFVFRMNDVWYMIPESSSSGEVCLYEAAVFPFRWEKKTVLLLDQLVDTTVFQQEGEWYLLSFRPREGSEAVDGVAYRISFGEQIRLSPVAWENQNSLEIRGAGPFIHYNGKLIRPAQLNKEDQYGNGLLFYEASVSDGCYREAKCGIFSANRMKALGYEIDGAHTYCRSSKFEVIDIRCRSFDLTKIPRSIKNKVK